MSDGFADAEAPARESLRYPFDFAPEPGQAIEIAPGLRWLRMPLFAPLNAINLWALEDGDGWTVVDTGMRTSATESAWEQVLPGDLGGRPVKRVIVTHMHPDHIGMAGWLRERFGCRLWMTRLEYVVGRMLIADTGKPAPKDALDFLHAAGWGADAIEGYRLRFGGFGKAVYPPPDSYRRLSQGDEVNIGGRLWRVIVGNGHSPEHACLWQPEAKLFISGDQVLPRISSNVSVFPTEPDADPLSDWLASCERLKREVPDDVLVLPSHRDPFYGLHARLDQLIHGHQLSLKRLERTLREPKRAVDVFAAVFGRQVGADMLGMATGEALAHLNWLIGQGRAVKEADEAGVVWYRAV